MENRQINTYGLFINGEFVFSYSGEKRMVENPATNEKIAIVYEGNEKDVDVAIEAAKSAYATWSSTSSVERCEVLLKVADCIDKNKEHLAIIECLDSGKPIVETREDIAAISDQFRYFAGCIRVDEGSFVEHDKESMSILVREPLGVVAQIIPWNFPFLMAGWKIAPAIAAGNTVVIKPAEHTPLSLLELAKLTKDIIPKGVLNIVTGPGRIVGNYMVNHKGISKIAFTGSTPVGSGIAKAAAERVVPVSLELGGKSANIIFPDAPMDKAIEGAAMGILYGQGQVCNAGSRLFVHRDIYDETVERLKEIFSKVVVGRPIDTKTRMGTLISEKQLDLVLDYVQKGIHEGATLAYGGKRLKGGIYHTGYYVEPTLLINVTNDMKVAQEEIFGPVLVVIPFTSEDEVIKMANDIEYGLAGACWTININRAIRIAKAIKCGVFWINEYHMAPSGAPFGGYKKSGYGRENHKLALESYSQIKNIYISLKEEKSGWYDNDEVSDK